MFLALSFVSVFIFCSILKFGCTGLVEGKRNGGKSYVLLFVDLFLYQNCLFLYNILLKIIFSFSILFLHADNIKHKQIRKYNRNSKKIANIV